jgi:hypothetical protein
MAAAAGGNWLYFISHQYGSLALSFVREENGGILNSLISQGGLAGAEVTGGAGTNRSYAREENGS